MSEQCTGKLAGKVALITGAGRGIGQALALAFAREGADIAINYRASQVGAEETAITALAFRGSETLARAALALVREGVTSPEEAVRVSRREAADA